MKISRIYFWGAVVLILSSFLSWGSYHPDEHFQLLEFAGYKLGITPKSGLPWEFRAQMRPTLQVFLIYWVYKLFHLFGEVNPFLVATYLRILSAGFAFLSIHFFYEGIKKELPNANYRKWFLLLSFFLWFAVFQHVRYSSENWSGIFFIFAFAQFLRTKENARFSNQFIIGILLGLSFVFRNQSAFLIGGFVVWLIFIYKEKITHFMAILGGIAIAIAIGILTDRWFYGEWVLTSWNYFYQNLVLDKVSGFGTHPWWYYFQRTFMRTLPPFSLFFIAAIFAVFIYKPKHPLTWSVLPFLVIHLLIGHKELRFLFPMLGLLPLFIVLGIEILEKKKNINLFDAKWFKPVSTIFWIGNLAVLAFSCFRPADDNVMLFQKLYHKCPSNASIYYIGQSPYDSGTLRHYFFQNRKIELKEIESIDELENLQQPFVFATKDKLLVKQLNENNYAQFTAYPDWLKPFDFNHWMEKGPKWKIFISENKLIKKTAQIGME